MKENLRYGDPVQASQFQVATFVGNYGKPKLIVNPKTPNTCFHCSHELLAKENRILVAYFPEPDTFTPESVCFHINCFPKALTKLRDARIQKTKEWLDATIERWVASDKDKINSVVSQMETRLVEIGKEQANLSKEWSCDSQ